MGAKASATVSVTPASYWAPYVAASGIVDSADDEAAIHFIADALKSTPLPSQWSIGTGEQGQRLFYNVCTGESTRRHPLEHVLRSLADIYQKCAPLLQWQRDIMLSGIHQKWGTEAMDYGNQWRTVKMEDGDKYYFNIATHEATWEHPAEFVSTLGHYMGLTAIERLRSQGYLDGLRSRACIACSNCSLERDVESEPLEWRLNLGVSALELARNAAALTVKLGHSIAVQVSEFRQKNNRRIKVESDLSGDHVPRFKATLWKLKEDTDRTDIKNWREREMWISESGSLVYFSVREDRDLVYYSASDLACATVVALDHPGSCKPWSFSVQLPAQGGVEFAAAEFAADSEELRAKWIQAVCQPRLIRDS